MDQMFRVSALLCLLTSLTACTGVERTTTFSVSGSLFDSTKHYPEAYTRMLENTNCKKDCKLKDRVQIERDKQGGHVRSGFALERTITY
jgi:hypothetical protein